MTSELDGLCIIDRKIVLVLHRGRVDSFFDTAKVGSPGAQEEQELPIGSVEPMIGQVELTLFYDKYR
ncbi:MAG TPA: hypothetical protein VK518_08500 [Puia sp.]|nr:hypothetical protein [Puia sp.]